MSFESNPRRVDPPIPAIRPGKRLFEILNHSLERQRPLFDDATRAQINDHHSAHVMHDLDDTNVGASRFNTAFTCTVQAVPPGAFVPPPPVSGLGVSYLAVDNEVQRRNLQNAEQEAQEQLQGLPENVAASLRDILIYSNMQKQVLGQLAEENARLQAQVESLSTLIRPQYLQAKPKKHIPMVPINNSMVVSTMPATSPPTISLAGHSYPFTTFPLSQNSYEKEKQLKFIAKLEAAYPVEKLAKHQFEWVRSNSECLEDEWLPVYSHWRPKGKYSQPSITEIWEEWHRGLDGYLSIKQLNETWGARWRRNCSSAKTEASRRKKVIALIETIGGLPGWDTERAVEYLKSTYPIPTTSVAYLKTPRTFIDHIQKKDGEFFREIVATAASSGSSL
ncbi:hypothetical protein H0H92_001786 [Tricholoma furcatifolium]|nr:hypothetical protein H0H92_001786 [Tricholoma furcatifolium]